MANCPQLGAPGGDDDSQVEDDLPTLCANCEDCGAPILPEYSHCDRCARSAGENDDSQEMPTCQHCGQAIFFEHAADCPAIQKREDFQECTGCGCSKWACDSYRTSGKACCPDCKHRPASPAMEAGRELARQLVHLERLVMDLQRHAREQGWQDVDEPIAALLAWRQRDTV